MWMPQVAGAVPGVVPAAQTLSIPTVQAPSTAAASANTGPPVSIAYHDITARGPGPFSTHPPFTIQTVANTVSNSHNHVPPSTINTGMAPLEHDAVGAGNAAAAGGMAVAQSNAGVGGTGTVSLAAAAAAAASAAPSNVSGGEIAAGPAGTGGTGSPSAGHDEQNGDGDSDPDGDGGVNRDDAEGIWSPDIEQSFQEALAIYPPCGRRKIILSDEGKMYGRNELIARYIKIRTGKIRTRKQVSSHIQVLARKRSRELQTKLKEAPTDKEQGKLHSIVHSLPGMSSAQIVSTQFHDDGDEMNNPSAANNAAGGAPGGPGGNHLAAAMKPESYQHGDGTLTSGPAPVAMPVGPNAHGHSQMMPRTVGAVSAAAATTGSSSLKAEQQQQHGGSVTTSGLGNAVLCAAPVPSNAAANPLWHSSAAVHSFHDPMRYGVPAAAGHPAMMAGVSPGFIMPMTAHGSTMPLVGQTSQVVHPGMNHISATPAVAAAAAASVTGGVTSMSAPVPMTNNSSSLVSLTAFKEDHPASDSSDGVVFSQHCFVHIPPTTNFHDPSLESIEIRQVCDKFPTLSDLYEKGPPDVFFLVKFWADIDMPEATGPENFYVSTVFRTADQVKCKCTTDVCSFGQPVVQKVEVLNSTFENGAHMVRSMRSKMCDYMVKFIRKLVALDSRAQMNEVLENFTIMQVVCNGDTGELLMCLAYAFEVSGSDTSGTYHNIYRLIKA
ncbi:transcriptional enhancer factor TEF-1-like isoform X2 [Sycon ciliatum]